MTGSPDKQSADAYDERYERYRRQRHEAAFDAVMVTEPEHAASVRRIMVSAFTYACQEKCPN